MEQLTEPTLFIFLLQTAVFIAYIPVSYLAYRWVRAPLKRERVKRSLLQLGITQTEQLEETLSGEYHLKHYIWPLLVASGFTFTVYAGSHAYIIQLGITAGFVEEVINIFDADDLFPRAILVGRIGLWSLMGAYIYSVHLTFRRFMMYDLTPTVYIFTTNRFALAIVVGTVVGIALGTFNTAAGVSFNVNTATVAIVTFFIGFFPDQGITWIAATAKKALGQQGGIAKETRLSEIEGLSIWHQGRLKQEGIENVQNLATADIPALVVGTPFTVNQIIDWLDQAIFLIHTHNSQVDVLSKSGIVRASDVLTNTNNGRNLNDLADATEIKKSKLKVLSKTLQTAVNIKLVTRFRWQSSLDGAKVAEAATIQPFQTPPTIARLPREQEALMLDAEA